MHLQKEILQGGGKTCSIRVFRFSGSFMKVELVQVLMSLISSLFIREIRLTTTGK